MLSVFRGVAGAYQHLRSWFVGGWVTPHRSLRSLCVALTINQRLRRCAAVSLLDKSVRSVWDYLTDACFFQNAYNTDFHNIVAICGGICGDSCFICFLHEIKWPQQPNLREIFVVFCLFLLYFAKNNKKPRKIQQAKFPNPIHLLHKTVLNSQ